MIGQMRRKVEEGELSIDEAEAMISGSLTPARMEVWPTPKSSPSGPDYARRNREGSGGDDLATQIGGQLNPMWVEWLMGFPLGWTDLEDSGTP